MISPLKPAAYILFLLLNIVNQDTPTWAGSAASGPAGKAPNKVQVILFGQSCILSGPFDSETLKAVHSISPEQVSSNSQGESARIALLKLKEAKTLPPLLERYQTALIQRLEALLGFSNSLADAKKVGNAGPILGAAKKFLPETRLEGFTSQVRKAGINPAQWNSAAVDQIKVAYQNALGPTPDEDFQRSIRKLGIEYNCSYE